MSGEVKSLPRQWLNFKNDIKAQSSTTTAKDLLTDLVSKSYFFFLGVGEGDGGISAGSICGIALIRLIGSVPPI